MSFHFKPDESLSNGVQRIVSRQIEKALDELAGRTKSTQDEAVHEARKCIKKIRAVARLVRKDLGSRTFARANVRLRDAARPLSEVRDAQILVEAVGRLAKHFSGEVAAADLAAVEQALTDRRRLICIRTFEHEDALTKASATLEEIGSQVRAWNVDGNWSSLQHGLKRIYRDGRKALDRAVDSPAMETLHELRKRVKDLTYQLELLKPMRSRSIKRPLRQTETLGDLLGDDHDLAVLHQVVLDEASIDVEPVTLGLLLTLIERRRSELQEQALEIAHEVYAEPPQLFLQRLRAYWHAWRSEAAAARFDPVAPPPVARAADVG